MEQALDYLNGLPPALIYVVLSGGAVIENLLPVVPADTFIVTGGFLAGLGTVSLAGLFLAVWAANTGGAVAVYAAGRKYGPEFFRSGPGRHFMSQRQMVRLEDFYRRWGVATIFVARFLPGFRALVPVFAGVARQGWAKVVPPLLAASAIWYGGLVRLGYLAGENLEAVVATLAQTNRALLVLSLVLGLFVVVGWWHVRRGASERERADTDNKTSTDPSTPGESDDDE